MRPHQGAAQQSMEGSPSKPTMRGVLHQWASVAVLGAGFATVLMAPTTKAALAGAIYASCLFILFSVSASYHRPMWDDKMRERMRRLDHSCIFILIGGTYTPIAMLALPEEIGREVLWVVWGGALLGVLRVHLWRRAPRFITIIPYLLLGWLAAFYLKHFLSALTPEQSWLFFGGGIPYSLGAIVYALKRPEPVPGVFGHHEVFHALTLVASACHFSAVMLMVRGHIS